MIPVTSRRRAHGRISPHASVTIVLQSKSSHNAICTANLTWTETVRDWTAVRICFFLAKIFSRTHIPFIISKGGRICLKNMNLYQSTKKLLWQSKRRQSTAILALTKLILCCDRRIVRLYFSSAQRNWLSEKSLSSSSVKLWLSNRNFKKFIKLTIITWERAYYVI